MEQSKTFLDTLQVTIRKLQLDGFITQEQLEQKIDIPIKWLYSKDLDRELMITAMNNICKSVNQSYSKNVKENSTIDHIRICERNKKIIIEVPGVDNWTYFCLSDNNLYHKNKKGSYRDSREFLEEIYKLIRDKEMDEIKQDIDKLSTEEVIQKMNSFHSIEKKEQILDEISNALSDMIENFGEYFRYLYTQKDEKLDALTGGLVKSEESNKQIDAGTFQKRKQIFMDLNPENIIVFSSITDKKQIQNEVYISYVYKNDRENNGYFLIIEPFGENISTRAIYFTDEMIQKLQSASQEKEKFWENLSRIYVEMPIKIFKDEDRTQTFNHTSLDTFAARMKYIISGKIDEKVPKNVIYSAKMNLTKLFGNTIKLGEITKNVPEEEIEQARRHIKPRTKDERQGEEK